MQLHSPFARINCRLDGPTRLVAKICFRSIFVMLVNMWLILFDCCDFFSDNSGQVPWNVVAKSWILPTYCWSPFQPMLQTLQWSLKQHCVFHSQTDGGSTLQRDTLSVSPRILVDDCEKICPHSASSRLAFDAIASYPVASPAIVHHQRVNNFAFWHTYWKLTLSTTSCS